MAIEKRVKQLEFEFMKEIRKEVKREARNFYIFIAGLYLLTAPLLIGGIKLMDSNFLDDSKIIKGNYSESIEKVPYLLRPYVQVGFPYFWASPPIKTNIN